MITATVPPTTIPTIAAVLRPELVDPESINIF
jgi:hypothetical protein